MSKTFEDKKNEKENNCPNLFFNNKQIIFAQIVLPSYPDSIFSTYYLQRVSHFETKPQTKDDIIFAVNSITDGAEWDELFDDLHVKNRSISGDITAGVIHRLDEIANRKPAGKFLLMELELIESSLSVR